MTNTKDIVPQTPAQRAIVERALKLKAALHIASESDFFRRVLQPHTGWSFTTWHRIREDMYQARADKKIAELERALNVLTAQRVEQGEEATAVGEFHPHRWWDEARMSVEICAQRLCKERATMLVARSGFGKTAVARSLVAWAKHATGGDGKPLFPGGAFFRECDESWRTHKPIFEHFADMLAIGGTWRGGRDVSEAVINGIRAKGAMFVALDECQYWTPHAVNALKTLINRTPLVPFFDTTPDLLAQFRNKSWETWEQMQERIFRTIHVRSFHDDAHADGLTAAEVLPFLAAFRLNGAAEKIAEEIAESANYSGGFGRVQAVIDVVAYKFDGAWTLANTAAAIEEVEAAKGINTKARRKLQRAAAKQATEGEGT